MWFLWHKTNDQSDKSILLQSDLIYILCEENHFYITRALNAHD